MRRFVRYCGVLALSVTLPGAAFAQSMLGNTSPANPTDQNTVVVPPAPAIVPAAPSAPMPQVVTPQSVPPGLVQTPLPPPNTDTGQAGNDGTAPADNGAPSPAGAAPAHAVAAPAAPAAPDTASSTPPPPTNNWLPAHTAEIGLLDKVDGGASTVSIPVGGQMNAGDLQINVLACVTRPPDEIPDAAAFIAIQPLPAAAAATAAADSSTEAAAGAPIFRGWMVRSIPGATVVGDASETLRVVSCS
jgi:hypothetical protein